MTHTRYLTYGEISCRDNPLVAALPLRQEVRRAFLASPLQGLRYNHGKDLMAAAHGRDAPRLRLSQLEIESSLSLLMAVHDSLLDSYRPRNPMGATTPGDRIIAFGSAPITLLTWETGADLAAKNLFDRVLGALPTVIDHVEFNGRAFVARQLVHTSITVDPLDIVRGSCLQIVEATDLALGTRHSDRFIGSEPSLTFARNAAQACEGTSLGLLGIHLPMPLAAKDAEDLWDLAALLQLRCGIALLICCSEFAARRMVEGGPSGRRLLDGKLFWVKRNYPIAKEMAQLRSPER